MYSILEIPNFNFSFMGVEFPHIDPESQENHHLFSLGEIYQDRKLYNDFQRSKLIPLAYALRHPQEPRAEDGNVIAMEWITSGDAKKLEEYIQGHSEEKIDTEDEKAVKAFLLAVDPELKETLH